MCLPVNVGLVAGHNFVKVLQNIPPELFNEHKIGNEESKGQKEQEEPDQPHPSDEGDAATTLRHGERESVRQLS